MLEIPASYLQGRAKEDFFLLNVSDDSMYPMYQKGDHLLVAKQQTLDRPGSIEVVEVPEGLQTRKVEPTEKNVKLVCINPEFPDTTVDNVRIVGSPFILVRCI